MSVIIVWHIGYRCIIKFFSTEFVVYVRKLMSFKTIRDSNQNSQSQSRHDEEIFLFQLIIR